MCWKALVDLFPVRPRWEWEEKKREEGVEMVTFPKFCLLFSSAWHSALLALTLHLFPLDTQTVPRTSALHVASRLVF
ncbi:hypothetical protein TNIN_364771 [Trichonephila inaurata madagascariensis]|uniref:Uncharacterized protein n=1 Tax=Trichonephila inaurata madagascariensis TaxID=2747483 RepID=A0A8X6YCP1_9ARAC|nr:hypothetical protein TNIN_364771 [Trichonephila inaurata madagascariensis]